jgi:uncharacterized protein DUF2442
MRPVRELIGPKQDAPVLTAVEVIGDYSVRATFSDGQVRETDLSRSFVDPTGARLGDPADFARVRLDTRSDTLVWTNGLHVHGELLYGLAADGTGSVVGSR